MIGINEVVMYDKYVQNNARTFSKHKKEKNVCRKQCNNILGKKEWREKV